MKEIVTNDIFVVLSLEQEAQEHNNKKAYITELN